MQTLKVYLRVPVIFRHTCAMHRNICFNIQLPVWHVPVALDDRCLTEVINILGKSEAKSLDIREAGKNVFISGLSYHAVTTMEQILELIQVGL